uniref:replicative DNA helicase n=1 Tax=Janthinobacterium sp. TaxID=1871054 RepID=UPI00293D5469
GLSLMALGNAESQSPEQLIGEAEAAVLQIADKRSKDSPEDSETIGRLLYQEYARSEEAHERGTSMLGLSTGLPGIDRLTSGLQSPDFWVLAGRPGCGKTSLLLHMALHVALQEHRPVALFSLEMSKEQYALRIACMLARLDSHKLRMGDLTQDEWDRYALAVQECYSLPLVINDSPGCTIAELSSVIRRIRRDYNDLAFVGVDYLQLMSAKSGSENRTQAVSELSRDLKSIARQERVPLMALSQLSRSVESRENKRPLLSDLRESGSIEADSDLVAFLYNESYYARLRNSETVITERTTDEVEFIVAKHRNGATGNIRIGFQPTYTRFADMTLRDDEPTGF